MIDCDDVPGGAEALGQIRNTPANKQTYILAIVNGSTGTRAAIALGANFVLSKPIQQTLPGILPVAIAEMEREHRRYFRYDVDLPVWFQNALGQSCTARMKNVSESGLAIFCKSISHFVRQLKSNSLSVRFLTTLLLNRWSEFSRLSTSQAHHLMRRKGNSARSGLRDPGFACSNSYQHLPVHGAVFHEVSNCLH